MLNNKSIDSTKNKKIPGLLRRSAAYAVDIFFLIICCVLLLRFTGDLLVWSGYERLIGLGFTFFYFFILNTKAGKGQTIGSRFLRIKVVKKDGSFIGFRLSMIRSFVSVAPIFMINLNTSFISENNLAGAVLSLIGITTPLISLFLILTDTVSRRSLQDIAGDSLVVKYDSQPDYPVKSVGKTSLIIAALIIVIIISMRLYALFSYGYQLRSLESEIKRFGNLNRVSISKTFEFKDKAIITKIVINAVINDVDSYVDTLSSDIVKLVSERLDYLDDSDIIELTVSYGADIGLYNNYSSITLEVTAGELGD